MKKAISILILFILVLFIGQYLWTCFKKGHEIDTIDDKKEYLSTDVDAYNLIMKDKERLLSLIILLNCGKKEFHSTISDSSEIFLGNSCFIIISDILSQLFWLLILVCNKKEE